MSFAIEVPGEASPLGFQELCRTLQLASTSPDHAQRQSAGQQLSSWEQTQVDYYPLLQVCDSIACSSLLDNAAHD